MWPSPGATPQSFHSDANPRFGWTIRVLASALFTIALGACKHPLEIVGEGDIIDVNGTVYGCTLAQFSASDPACSENEVEGDYSVEYVGIPKPGWMFVRWEGPCVPESVAPSCRLEASGSLVAAWDQSYSDTPIPPTIAVFEEVSAGTISGNITYDFVPANASGTGLDFGNIQALPARGVTVQILAGAGGTVLGSGSTGASGHYAIAIDWPSQSVRVRARAELLRQGTPGWNFQVTDNTRNNGLYAIQTGTFSSNKSGARNLHAASGWSGSGYTSTRSAAPFAILDTVYKATQLILAADKSAVFPDLELRWSENNNTATAGGTANGDIGTSYYGTGDNINEAYAIYILGKADDDTDEYDSVVGHEVGHYIADALSRDDSMGGAHGLGDALDMRVSFSEAWGTAFNAMLSGSEIYSDALGPGQGSGWSANVESFAAADAGWWDEDALVALLYDIYDDKNDGADKLAAGFKPIYEAMVGLRSSNAMISVFSFLDELAARKPGLTKRVNKIATAQGIRGNPVDSFASTETNRPNGDPNGQNSVLPLYQTLAPGDEAVTACSIIDLDPLREGNKAGIRRLFIVDIPSRGNYSFRAVRTSGKAAADPDMLLYRRGKVISRGESAVVNSEEMATESLAKGRHVLEVYEYLNTQPQIDTPGNVCFEVSAS